MGRPFRSATVNGTINVKTINKTLKIPVQQRKHIQGQN